MAPKDQDTDPSTPGARRADPRAALRDTEPTPKAHGTDPGLGPGPAAARPRAPGSPAAAGGDVVVPPAPEAKPNDSVDLLLDGITGTQPERTKTTPQSAGQASASYHAEHVVRPARTSPDEMPKVLVDRPTAPPTLRIHRTALHQAVASMMATGEGEQPTVVRPPGLGPRVLVAVVAGLVVVMGLFVVLKLTAAKQGAATGTTSAATAVPVAPATSATVTATATVAPDAPTTTARAPEPEATTPAAIAVPSLSTAPAATAVRPASSTKPKAKPAATATSDLGEFKTTFH
jgi:hypothetical protein